VKSFSFSERFEGLPRNRPNPVIADDLASSGGIDEFHQPDERAPAKQVAVFRVVDGKLMRKPIGINQQQGGIIGRRGKAQRVLVDGVVRKYLRRRVVLPAHHPNGKARDRLQRDKAEDHIHPVSQQEGPEGVDGQDRDEQYGIGRVGGEKLCDDLMDPLGRFRHFSRHQAPA